MSQQTCTSCGHSDPSTESICSQCGAPYPVDTGSTRQATTLRPGEVLANRYVIEKMIGKGGMGCIYQVRDNTLGETVALKTLLPEYVKEKAVVERFFNEARIARGLSHPHIVRVHDIGITDGMAYISMELLPGRTLRAMLDKVRPGRRIPLNAILRMFDALCAALDYAHSYTIHRDIKPENVMVLPDGTIKLMDFGISKLMSNPNLTSPSMVMGTPHYMSPEQLKNSANVDARADIYSVGIMLYEALTGDIPTGLSRENDTLREVPAALDPIIAKCCDRDPAKRYQTVAELRTALRTIRKQVETSSPESTPQPRKKGLGSASGLLRKVAAILLLGLVGTGTYTLWNKAESRRIELNAAIIAEPRQESIQNNSLSSPKPPPSPDTFEDMRHLAQRAKQKASSALLAMENSVHCAQATRCLEEAAAHWALALESEDSDPGLAFNEGWLALHRYIAVTRWPENMAFIPEQRKNLQSQGTTYASPFFVDINEVTADSFSFFGQVENWRWPDGTLSGDRPMTNATYYDAVGYLNSLMLPKKLPTQDQWRRALDQLRSPAESMSADETSIPDATIGWFGTPLDEWARSDFRDPDATRWFGRPIPILGVTEDGYPDDVEAMRYEQRNPRVTFRGVWELPTTLSAVENMLQ
ncbi:MAG: protein kinase [Candidatus Hydrogenedentota bacterium]